MMSRLLRGVVRVMYVSSFRATARDGGDLKESYHLAIIRDSHVSRSMYLGMSCSFVRGSMYGLRMTYVVIWLGLRLREYPGFAWGTCHAGV